MLKRGANCESAIRKLSPTSKTLTDGGKITSQGQKTGDETKSLPDCGTRRMILRGESLSWFSLSAEARTSQREGRGQTERCQILRETQREKGKEMSKQGNTNTLEGRKSPKTTWMAASETHPHHKYSFWLCKRKRNTAGGLKKTDSFSDYQEQETGAGMLLSVPRLENRIQDP